MVLSVAAERAKRETLVFETGSCEANRSPAATVCIATACCSRSPDSQLTLRSSGTDREGLGGVCRVTSLVFCGRLGVAKIGPEARRILSDRGKVA